MAQSPYSGVPTVAPNGPGGNLRQNISSSPADFGGLEGAATQKLGGDLSSVGANLVQSAVQAQNLYNQVSVQAARNEQEDTYHKIAFGDSKVPGDVGIFGLYGRAAMDARPAAMEKLEAARERIRDTLPNDAQRLAFDSESHRYKTIIADSIGRHVDNQAHAWALETNKASGANAAQIISNQYNNNQSFDYAFGQRMTDVERTLQLTGGAADVAISTQARNQAAADMVVSRLETWSTRGNPIEAMNWLKTGMLPDGRKVQESLPPHIVGTLEHTLKGRVDQLRVKGFVNSWSPGAGDGSGAPLVATDLPAEASRILPAIASGESPDYNVRYTPAGGTQFASYDRHPNISEPGPEGPSTAAGRYQFTKTTWDRAANALGLTDFSPESQDRAAWWNAQRVYAANTNGRNLQADIAEGGHESGIRTALKDEWTSLRSDKGANTFMGMLRGAGSGAAGGAPLTTRNPDVFAAEQSLVDRAREQAKKDFPNEPLLQEQAVRGVEQRIEHTNIRQRQYDVAVDKQRKDAALQAEQEYTPRILTDPTNVDVNKLATDPRLIANPDAMIRLNNLLKVQLAGQTEKVSAVSANTMNALLRGMRLPQGAPGRIDNLDPAYQAVTDGYMTTAHFDWLYKQFHEMKTPAGERLNETQGRFFKTIEPAIVKSDLSGIKDPGAPLEFFRLQQDVARKVEEFRKAGKDPFDLFNPNKPDYVGSPEALVPYQRDLQQVLDDRMARMRPGTAAQTAPSGPGLLRRTIEGMGAPPPTREWTGGETPGWYTPPGAIRPPLPPLPPLPPIQR